MVHKLMPAEGKPYLAPDDVVRRLRDEFDVVETNGEEGRDHAQSVLVQFIKMQSGGMAGADAHIDRILKVRDAAVMVVIADAPHSQDGRLRFAVIPGEPIIVGYWSGRHQRLAEPLLKRCSEALGYSVELA